MHELPPLLPHLRELKLHSCMINGDFLSAWPQLAMDDGQVPEVRNTCKQVYLSNNKQNASSVTDYISGKAYM